PPAAASPDSGRRRSPWRRLLLVLLAVVVLIGLLLGTLSIIFSTEAGSRWAVNRLVSAVNAEDTTLSVGSTEGTLLWGLRLTQIAYDSGENRVQVARLSSRWDLLPLLYRQLNLEALQ